MLGDWLVEGRPLSGGRGRGGSPSEGAAVADRARRAGGAEAVLGRGEGLRADLVLLLLPALRQDPRGWPSFGPRGGGTLGLPMPLEVLRASPRSSGEVTVCPVSAYHSIKQQSHLYVCLHNP